MMHWNLLKINPHDYRKFEKKFSYEELKEDIFNRINSNNVNNTNDTNDSNDTNDANDANDLNNSNNSNK